MVEILSIKETIALMAMRTGITTGGGIEMNTPNPGPRAAEPPMTEDELVSAYRIKAWMERQRQRDLASENMRKKVTSAGGQYVKPLRWKGDELSRLNKWRRETGVSAMGTGMTGRRTQAEMNH